MMWSRFLANFLFSSILVVTSAQAAYSADIFTARYPHEEGIERSPERNFGNPFIVVQGEILDGDLLEMTVEVEYLMETGFPLVVLLNSPGGNYDEAADISRFIQEMYGTTWLNGRTSTIEDEDRSINVCAGACPLIFLAGVERRYSGNNLRLYAADDDYDIPQQFRVSREGGFLSAFSASDIKMESIPVLSLHRPDLPAASSGPEFRQRYRDAEEAYVARLTELEVPSMLIEESLRHTKSNPNYLNSDDLQNIGFIGPVRWFSEWLQSTCGSMTPDEANDLSLYRFNQAVGAGSGDFSQGYLRYLENTEAGINECERELLLRHQTEVLSSMSVIPPE